MSTLPWTINDGLREKSAAGWRRIVRKRPHTRFVAVGVLALVILVVFYYKSADPERTHVSWSDPFLTNILPPDADVPDMPTPADHVTQYDHDYLSSDADLSDSSLPIPEFNQDDEDDILYAADSATSSKWAERAEAVKEGFVHAYSGWEEHAWPHDELLPVTNGSVDNFNGWGVTLYDALDTMLLMGLHDEFARALPLVKRTTFKAGSSYAPFFETVIRYLGGLLSAYALSHEPILRDRADDLGGLLSAAFETESGFPVYSVNVKGTSARPAGVKGTGVLAEIASCQMEYKYLAHVTGKKEYYDRANKIQQRLENANLEGHDGLWPTRWNLVTGQPSNNQISIGAYADSAYEYLLKQWLMTAQTDHASLEMYLRLANEIIEQLILVSPKRKLMYVTDVTNGVYSHTHEHLSCFLPGLFALGVHTLGSELPASDKELHLWAARGLAYTCYITYADQSSGIGPDEVSFTHVKGSQEDSRWVVQLEKWRSEGAKGQPPGVAEAPAVTDPKARDYTSKNKSYALRPETVEALYLLWRTTGEEAWRERGWEIFEALERECRTESGYASLDDVEYSPAPKRNKMPSYFLAETLKYLYLLFLDEEIVPLDSFVFNTEAHPFPVFQWTGWEKEKFGIKS